MLRCGFLFLVLSGISFAGPLFGAVRKVEIDSREILLEGRNFGSSGPYELLKGRVQFGLDPAHPANERIVDLKLAPRNEEGEIEARANLVVLKPVNPDVGNGIVLVEISNRGGKFSLNYFNRATDRSLAADNPESFGDGLLLRRGFTVVWIGWQADVPLGKGLLRLEAAVAKGVNGESLTGLVRSDWTVDDAANTLPLSHRKHIYYRVDDPAHPDNVLTVRDGRDAERIVVPRPEWQFTSEDAANDSITLQNGFQAGRIYELVYQARDPVIIGLGLAVIRDIVSHAKYHKNSPFPARYGISAGISQTGRFLRKFLYDGFNTDEEGRIAYDGMMIITAGAGRGSFNHRFAQPSRDGHRYSAFLYPTDIFPFSSRTQFDPVNWRSDGLLAHIPDMAFIPKLFYINTGYEYWGRAAALIHTTIDGQKDVEPLGTERIYHLAGGQHFVAPFPPEDKGGFEDERFFRGNPLEFKVNYRALLVRLAEWVSKEIEPPANVFPRLSNATLTRLENLKFPGIPGVEVPLRIHNAYRVDYGPRWGRGIIDHQPPKAGPSYPVLIPQVDSFGNELGGVRNVELRVPLATFTPWSLRTGFPGGDDEMIDFWGNFLPFPKTASEKSKSGDPRPAIKSLYPNREKYLKKVRLATQELSAQGFLLPEDLDYIAARAAEYWNWIFRNSNEQ